MLPFHWRIFYTTSSRQRNWIDGEKWNFTDCCILLVLWRSYCGDWWTGRSSSTSWIFAAHVILKITGYVMNLARLRYSRHGRHHRQAGHGHSGNVFNFYRGVLFQSCAVVGCLGLAFIVIGKRVVNLVKRIKEPILLAFSTASSEVLSQNDGRASALWRERQDCKFLYSRWVIRSTLTEAWCTWPLHRYSSHSRMGFIYRSLRKSVCCWCSC